MQEILLQAGACRAGCVSSARLRPFLTEEQWQKARGRTPGFASLLCAAFPYGPAEPRPGPVSLYARGADYHQVLKDRLEGTIPALEERCPGHHFHFWADVSPFPEVTAAALAGLGRVGRHGLLITPNAGSYVFLGFLSTDAPLPDTGGEIAHCPGCGACKNACPGGALAGRLDQDRCLSAITQKRGELDPGQTALLRQTCALWGCDRCQLACPENRARIVPPLPEFAPLPDPTSQELQLSDRAFRRQFAGRAFTWRGVQPLRRNDQIIQKE